MGGEAEGAETGIGSEGVAVRAASRLKREGSQRDSWRSLSLPLVGRGDHAKRGGWEPLAPQPAVGHEHCPGPLAAQPYVTSRGQALDSVARRPFRRAHFRRQVPLAPYYGDFASHTVKLVVEVDGGQHFDDAAIARDAKRTAYVETDGYRVLRFTTVQVPGHIDAVSAAILASIET